MPCPPASRNHFRRSSAFTAIEALIASAILAILTSAVSGALMAGRAQSQLARDTLSASFLAQSMMDEIMRLPFNDPNGYTTMGPQSGQTRANFDNISDYSGYTDGPGNVNGSAAIADLSGNAYADIYQKFQRTVTMQAVSNSPSGWNRTVTGLLITVDVTYNGQELIKLQRIAWD